MAARVRVLHLERIGERLNAGEEQLLEAAGLRGDALLERVLIVAVLEHEPPLLERLPHARADFLEVERLGEVVHRADRQTAHGDLDVGDGGDHDDGRVGLALAHLAQQLDAVHLRHAQIAQHERHRLPLEHRQRFDAVDAASKHVKPSLCMRRTSTCRRRGSSSTTRHRRSHGRRARVASSRTRTPASYR